MRRAWTIGALLAGALLAAPRGARAGARAEEVAAEEAWAEALASPSRLAPFEPIGGRGSLELALELGAGRRVTERGTRTEWFAGVVIAIPFERLLGAGRPRAPAAVFDGFPRGLAAHPEDTMNGPEFMGGSGKSGAKGAWRPRRWGAAWVLPTALAAAPFARGAPTGPSGGSQGRSSVSSILASPSLAASLRLPPSVAASLRASAASSASPSVALSITASPRVEARAADAGPVAPALPSGALRELVRAAWREASIEDDARLDAMGSRARSAAWAPELRVRAYRGTNNGASVYATADVADRATLSDGVSTMVETRLSWRLDRLVFADEEIAIERVRLERAELRQRLAARVIELALAWLRARRAAEDPSLLGPDRELARDTATEALLALDALTGGSATRLLTGNRE